MSSRHCAKGSFDMSQFSERLDGVERIFCFLNDRGTFLTTFTLFLETSVPLSLQVLRQTAWHWVNRHARLRARIDSNGDNYKDASFVEMSSLTVDDMPVQEVGHGDWKYVNETELEEKLDCINGLLWRLRFVPGATNEFDEGGHGDKIQENDKTQEQQQTECPEIINCAITLVIHHCICDGIGTANLMGEYIDILTCLLRSKPVPEVVEPACNSLCNLIKPLSLPESVAMRLLALPVPGFSHVLMRLIKRSAPVKTRNVPLLPVGDYQKPLHRIFPLVLSEVDTMSLVAGCRQRGCTVQGAIQASIGLALAQIRPGEHAAGENVSCDFKVQYAIPVNLRQRLKNTHIPNSVVRNYISSVYPSKTFSSDLSQEDLWEAAREISTDIHRRIKDNEPMKQLRSTLGHNALFRRSFECLDKISDGALRNGWNSNVVVLSNLGVCECLDEKDPIVKPRAVLLTVSSDNSSFMYTMGCITINKRLCVTLATRRNIVSDELADGIQRAFQQALMRFTNWSIPGH